MNCTYNFLISMKIYKFCFIFGMLVIAPINLVNCTTNICTENVHNSECKHLDAEKTYKCIKYSNKLDCLFAINNGTTQLARIAPDEALLASEFLENITVIANTASIGYYEMFDNALIVMSKTNITSFDDLKGMKMCHPGYGKLNLPRYYLNKFDETVLDMLFPERCQKTSNTINEIRYSSLSQVFGNSCFPGPWVYDENDDKQLKKKHKKLCEACTTTETDKCSIEKILDPFKEALKCFQNGGDIVLLSYNTWNDKEFKTDLSQYYFLHPNGTSTKSDECINCFWGKRPKNLLVADSTHYNDVQQEIIFNIFKEKIIGSRKKRNKRDLSPYLNSIILPYSSDQLLPVNNIKLKPFLKALENVTVLKNCNRTVRWCVISPEEHKKCRWLSQATINQGIMPTIECVETKNQMECIDRIGDNNADIINLSFQYRHAAKKKHLEAIAYSETPKSGLTKMFIVTNDITNINTSKFKNKMDCFSKYDVTDKDKCNLDACLGFSGHFEAISFKNLSGYDNYTIVCMNGNLINIKNLNNVDDDCHVNITHNSELVIRKNDENKKNIIELLNGLQQEFGEKSRVFKLFGSFNGLRDLLFEDSTTGISFDSNKYYFSNLHATEKTCANGEASKLFSNQLLLFTFSFLGIWISFFDHN